jgi:hypothetical protein
MKRLKITISIYGLIIGMIGTKHVYIDPQESVVEYLYLDSTTEFSSFFLN